MNKAAFARYAGRPAAVGRSIFDCHNSESNAMIVSIVERILEGEDEVLVGRKGRAHLHEGSSVMPVRSSATTRGMRCRRQADAHHYSVDRPGC